MTKYPLPVRALVASSDVLTRHTAKLSGQSWFTGDVNAVVGDAVYEAVQVSAPLVVAAELRRIADETHYGAVISSSLHERANKLDPEGATSENPDGAV